LLALPGISSRPDMLTGESVFDRLEGHGLVLWIITGLA